MTAVFSAQSYKSADDNEQVIMVAFIIQGKQNINKKSKWEICLFIWCHYIRKPISFTFTVSLLNKEQIT